MTHISATFSAELKLPGNIHDLLDGSLVPVPDEMISTTQLFYVDGEPDLFVRLSESSMEHTEASVAAMHGLREHGVDVLPAKAVEHDGSSYVVTRRVDGPPLDEVLVGHPEEPLLSRIDNTWAALAVNLAFRNQRGECVPGDVEGPQQYMFGTVCGDDQPRLWLVDFPYYAHDISDPGEYAEQLLYLANSVVDLRLTTGTAMTRSKTAVRSAAENAEDSRHYGDGILRAVEYALDNDVVLDLGADELLVEELRTF